jgi:mitochondrial import receptor subunit TOM40
MWNLNSREANASFGYDYVLRQCRLRGRIDTGAPKAAGLSQSGLTRWVLMLHEAAVLLSQCDDPCMVPCAEGKIAAFLEERLNVGVNFVLSAEGGSCDV